MSIYDAFIPELHDAYMQQARKATLEQVRAADEIRSSAGLGIDTLPAIIVSLATNYQSVVRANHS